MKKTTNLDKRVAVDLPITVSVDNDEIKSSGRVSDLSINGMQVSLPLPFGMIDENTVDFDLELPNPFSKIKGRGTVQWKSWDEDKNCMQCGLKLEPMTLNQLSDIDEIVTELSEKE